MTHSTGKGRRIKARSMNFYRRSRRERADVSRLDPRNDHRGVLCVRRTRRRTHREHAALARYGADATDGVAFFKCPHTLETTAYTSTRRVRTPYFDLDDPTLTAFTRSHGPVHEIFFSCRRSGLNGSAQSITLSERCIKSNHGEWTIAFSKIQVKHEDACRAIFTPRTVAVST